MLLTRLLAPWREHGVRLNNMEVRMTEFDDKLAEGVRYVALIKAEVASLLAQLDAEEADDQGQVDAAVAEARRADTERLGELVTALAEVLPAEVPEVPTPAPGEPAVGEGGSSDEVLAERRP